jgi:hypothetical protein
LYGAAYRYFGTWTKALIAAGLPPTSGWTKPRVLEAIRIRFQKHASVPAIWQNKSLATAAGRRFGSRRAALMAAGVIPPNSVAKHSMTRQRIKDTILERYEKGLRLTGHDNPDLIDHARRHFGSWNKAISAAGLVPRQFTKWSKQRVIDELQTLRRQGSFENSTRVPDVNLLSAARRQFGCLHKALVAAGILTPGDTLRRNKKWTRQQVIQAIQNRYLQGLPMTYAGDRNLAAAARKCFGSWTEALMVAGLSTEAHRKRRRSWSREDIIREIQARRRQGLKTTDVCRSDGRLAAAAQRYFGRWHNALVAAEILPPDAKPRTLQSWSRQRVIREIQQRQRQGLTLNGNAPANSQLNATAKRHFGSWNAAIIAAGAVGAYGLHRKWYPDSVLDEIRAQHERGVPMTAVRKRYRSLAYAARRYFGGWRKALAAAGVARGAGQ